jgi:hypothetical protein
MTTSLLHWDRSWGPDPKDYTQEYHIGWVLPWVTVVHDWNEARGRDLWRYHSLSGKRLAVHLAFQSFLWGSVFLLWGRRRRVTRGLPAAVEQAALARWGSGRKVTP